MQLFLHQWDDVLVKELVGGSIPSSFPWAIIEGIDGLLHLLPGHGPAIRLLREKLA